MFKAILIRKQGEGVSASVESVGEDQLPDADVHIDVQYSTLNYKDALAITGRGAVVRKFPMIPGIDLAGVVVSSKDSAFRAGDPVLLRPWRRSDSTHSPAV